MGRTTTIDTYCSYTGDAVLHGTIAVTIAGLSLAPADTYTLQLCSLVNDDVLAATGTVSVSGGGTATASLVLESAELIAAIGARREIAAQLYLDNTTDVVTEWNGQIRVRWAPEPTGFVTSTPGVPGASLADLTAHAALTSSVHGITAAAATVLDDATVMAMLYTQGGHPLHGVYSGLTDASASFNDTTHVLTLADAYVYHYQGQRVSVGAGATCDLDAFTLATGWWYVYHADATGVLTASQIPWAIDRATV